MLRLIYFFIYLKLNLIYLLPKMWRAKKLQAQGKADDMYDFIFNTAQRVGRGLVHLTGSTIHMKGLENVPEGPVLFVSNHQGLFDIPLLMGFINKPKSYIAKVELENIPVVSSWMKIGKCIFIDREDPRQSLKAINEGIEILKSGHSMVIFPEGTRSKGPQIAEFKKGSLRLATKSGVPIVPVTISGSYKIFEANGKLIKPAEVYMTIGEPIFTQGLTKEEENQLNDKVYAMVKSHL